MDVPLLARLITLRNVHPILTHTTNGLTPTALLFLVFSRSLDVYCLDQAAMYMMLVVAAITPFTMLTGYVDWVYRYGRRRFQLMDRKIIAAITGYVFVLAYVLSGSALLLGAAVAMFALTGEYGGRLVHGAVNAELVRKFRKKEPK